MQLASKKKSTWSSILPSIKAVIKSPTFIILAILTVGRIWLSEWIGAWMGVGGADDELLVSYAFLTNHFSAPTLYSLAKNMGYAIFLVFTHFTGLSYTMVLSLVWVTAAIVIRQMLTYLTKNKVFLNLSYLFVLFTPCAFDSWLGTRLYRNSIIAPFVLLLFSLLLIIFFRILKNKQIKARNLVGIGTITGILFAFNYYIKEDGIWLLACVGFATLVYISIISFRFFKNRKTNSEEKFSSKPFIRLIATLCIPLFVFILLSNTYKAINYHYFGVYETNTRTSGELGTFVENVYKVESENRTPAVWAPADAIEKTFAASETLQSYPELLTQIIETPWFDYNIYESPIQGDFLTWVIRDALVSANIWESDQQVNALFKQVNAEIDLAFANGTLQKDSRIQLVSSASGRTFNEILALSREIIAQYKITLFYDGYDLGGNDYIPEDYAGHIASYEKATVITNMNFLQLSTDAKQLQLIKQNYGNKMVSIIYAIYKVATPALFCLSIIGIVLSLIQCFGKYRKRYKYQTKISFSVTSIIVVLLGISLIYALGNAWFSRFIWYGQGITMIILKFYSVGLVPIFTLINLLGFYLFYMATKKFIAMRKLGKRKDLLIE